MFEREDSADFEKAAKPTWMNVRMTWWMDVADFGSKIAQLETATTAAAAACRLDGGTVYG
jgi:hypothetical protein